ncbi:hypothetical protein N7478_008743 [Penicillium angulare]|uniref:uncharacterized protein n=1 Tax=Penicillium angulare TaxID=116970 RepID=UPI002541436C|nr:uncharacterized protein N7478_008743 [Penicillium angulare]KAJ5273618.1 hypothetical protein N7478_008743 [Penicillium angulare]
MDTDPQLPPPGEPNRRHSEESIRDSDLPQLHVLKKRKVTSEAEIKKGKSFLKSQASFDINFWTQAAKFEELELKDANIKRKISICNSGLSEAEWSETNKDSQGIIEQIRASEQSRKICERQLHKLEPTSRWRGFRASFMQFFTTSKIGLGIQSTGTGKRDSRVQQEFRQRLIQEYQAHHPGQKWLWCPILGEYQAPELVIAAHLFPWKHGQTNMNAIFGKKKDSELFSPRNGVLISRQIEEVFDIGKLAIVPWLPDNNGFKFEALKHWLDCEQREYQMKVLDLKWDRLRDQVTPYHPLTFQDLDGRKLHFLGPARPAARYVYFHYCIQVLRSAWQMNEAKNSHGAAKLLEDENGKPFWGTPGRYLPKNMLLALVEELGHDYEALLDGASCNQSGDPDLLLKLAVDQVKSRRRSNLDGVFEPSDSELESEVDSEETETEE